MATLLDQTRAQLVVDVDSMDPTVAARHTGTGRDQRFCDMTSNQAIVCSEVGRPERADILRKAVEAVSAKPGPAPVEDVLDMITVLLAKEVYPSLTGRVHAQTSPPAAYDTARTIAHAERLVALFEVVGIPKTRVCIKIPATPESIVAMKHLEDKGIRTLATCLFSVSQAVAAAQAGCLYVAPYFNELRVHFEPALWKKYEDTVKEHPMCAVIKDIVETFKNIKATTLVMPASIVTSAEVVALTSLGPDHLTLSGAVLDQLASEPAPQNMHSAPDDPKPHHPDLDAPKPTSASASSIGGGPSAYHTDFLANGASALRDALAADAGSTRKLADALKIFAEMEDKTRSMIRAELEKVR